MEEEIVVSHAEDTLSTVHNYDWRSSKHRELNRRTNKETTQGVMCLT